MTAPTDTRPECGWYRGPCRGRAAGRQDARIWKDSGHSADYFRAEAPDPGDDRHGYEYYHGLAEGLDNERTTP